LRSQTLTGGNRRVSFSVVALAGVAFALAFLEPTLLRVSGSICAGGASMALIAYKRRDALRNLLRARSV